LRAFNKTVLRSDRTRSERERRRRRRRRATAEHTESTASSWRTEKTSRKLNRQERSGNNPPENQMWVGSNVLTSRLRRGKVAGKRRVSPLGEENARETRGEK
jgi:hypothetical protein